MKIAKGKIPIINPAIAKPLGLCLKPIAPKTIARRNNNKLAGTP